MNRLYLADIFQSHMVLQCRKPVFVWGSAPDDSVVTVELNGYADTCKAAAGKWLCTLPPQEPGENHTLTAHCSHPDTEPLIFYDISVGDVWLAGGQSNMEFFLRYDSQWMEIKKYKKNPKIHMFNVPQLAFEGHTRNTAGYGKWLQEGDDGFETFSAPGYSFARNIQPAVNVPVGIIGCNWGGSSAATWLDKDCLRDYPLSIYLDEYAQAYKQSDKEMIKAKSLEAWKFEDSPQHIADFMPLMQGVDEEYQTRYMEDHKNDPVVPMGPYHFNRPGGLYHTMLQTIIPFSIKGVLWYQGETDAIHAEIYDKLFTAMINWWRGQWRDDFPFLFVQLAPFGKWLDCDSSNYCILRQKQELVSKTVPNTAMVSIMDIGSYYDIHPKEKMEVGRRLALLARGKVYGEKILCESPEPEKAVRKGSEITLTFSNCRSLKDLCSISRQRELPRNISIQSNHFVLIQKDNEIFIDSIRIQENKIILTANALADAPCTVYFAWADYAQVYIYNEEGLPVKPFQITV